MDAQVKELIGGKIDGTIEFREYLKTAVNVETMKERLADLRETFDKLADSKKDPELG